MQLDHPVAQPVNPVITWNAGKKMVAVPNLDVLVDQGKVINK